MFNLLTDKEIVALEDKLLTAMKQGDVKQVLAVLKEGATLTDYPLAGSLDNMNAVIKEKYSSAVSRLIVEKLLNNATQLEIVKEVAQDLGVTVPKEAAASFAGLSPYQLSNMYGSFFSQAAKAGTHPDKDNVFSAGKKKAAPAA